MNTDYKRGYSRGYNAGSARRWPEHKPPHPPHDEVKALFDAARKLRDDADWFCSMIDPEDEWYQRLSPGIEAVDAAMVKVAEWLKSPPSEGASHES